jgi:predicted nucleic acid-binding protein
MIVVDNTFLSLLFYPKASPPLDPATGKPIHRLEDRLEELIENLREDRERILIPTPALAEFLYLAANDGPLYLAEIDSDSIYKVGDFDQKAAVELAAMNLEIKRRRSNRQIKRDEQSTDIKSKTNFDKQIVAIAVANEVRTIYSDDEGVENFASYASVSVIKMWQLPLPSAKQLDLINEEEPKRKRPTPKKQVETDEDDNEKDETK